MGWITLSDADDYINARRPDGKSVWFNYVDDDRTGYLNYAYDLIRRCRALSIPDQPNDQETDVLIDAQIEQALILAVSGEGGLRRRTLISGGVESAGIIKESYATGKKQSVAFSVMDMLDGFRNSSCFIEIPVYRDDS